GPQAAGAVRRCAHPNDSGRLRGCDRQPEQRRPYGRRPDMSGTESTIMPGSPEPVSGAQAGGSHASGPAALSAARLAHWSVRRELWEHRWIYITPLIVAAVFLVGFVIGATRIPLPILRPEQ